MVKTHATICRTCDQTKSGFGNRKCLIQQRRHEQPIREHEVAAPKPEKIFFRTVKIPSTKLTGNVYIRKEDVAYMLRDIGATEVTDVRNRLEEMAMYIESLK